MMVADLRRKGSVAFLALSFLLVVNVGLVVGVQGNENVVFEVQHKFKGRTGGNGRGSMLTSLKAHDSFRHGRMLAAIDVPLGGNGSPTDAALVLSSCSSSANFLYIYICANIIYMYLWFFFGLHDFFCDYKFVSGIDFQ